MTTALALIPSAPLAKRDLAAHLAALTDGQIQSLAYGENAEVVLDCEIPDWLAEAAYDEGDRRMNAKLAAGTHPAFPGRVFSAEELRA